MGDGASKPGDYREPELPAGVLEVRISVYKLKLTGAGFLDDIGASALGAYHSGLVVAGQEWSFGGHDEEGSSGVFTTDPELNPDYTFYQRVIVGRIDGTKSEVEERINQFADSQTWMGTNYDLTERNCNHFTSDLCWFLMKKRPPDWINQTCENLQRSRKKMKAEQASLKATLEIWQQQEGVTATSESEKGEAVELPGEKALKQTFETTYETAFSKHWNAGQKSIEKVAEGEDPSEVKAAVFDDALTRAAEAAQAAALEVAGASLVAKAAKAQQSPEGLSAWEQAWMRESSVLVKKWREDAINGNLKAEDQPARREQLDAALASAAKIAQAAVAEAEQQARIEKLAAARGDRLRTNSQSSVSASK